MSSFTTDCDLYYSRDHARLVEADDPEANQLAFIKGDMVDAEAAKRYGLKAPKKAEAEAAEKQAEAEEPKAESKAEAKAVSAPPENKAAKAADKKSDER